MATTLSEQRIILAMVRDELRERLEDNDESFLLQLFDPDMAQRARLALKVKLLAQQTKLTDEKAALESARRARETQIDADLAIIAGLLIRLP